MKIISFYIVIETIKNYNRKVYFDYLINENIHFINLKDIDKITYILNPISHIQVNALRSFLKQSIELSTGDS